MLKSNFNNQLKKLLVLIGQFLTVKTTLRSHKDLELLPDNTWLSLSDDPQFLVKSRGLKKGWYKLNVDLNVQQYNTAKLYLEYKHQGVAEEDTLVIPLKPTRGANRFFYIDKDLVRLRFDPVETTGEFKLTQFQLIKLPEFYAYRRLLIRIKNLHPELRFKSLKTLKHHLKTQAILKNSHWKVLALEAYSQTFSTTETAESFQHWVDHTEQIKLERFIALMPKPCSKQPTFSIVLPTYNTLPRHLIDCIQTVQNQTYPHWQLCIVDDASTQKEHLQLIHQYAQQDPRIVFYQRTQNGHISVASNDALNLATGEYTLLLDHDDLLCKHTLHLFTDAINKNPQAQLLYADEDKIDEYGNRFMPHFKPDWNPDLLYSQNYIGHPVIYKTQRLKDLGGFRSEVDGSQDHDLLLRYTQTLTVNEIIHLPWILYHWRSSEFSTALDPQAKSYTTQAGIKALQDFFNHQNLNVVVTQGKHLNTYHCQWPIPNKQPLVSLLIPTRDGYEILKTCIQSILEKTTYQNYEILILDNQTTCSKTLAYLKKLNDEHPQIRVLQWNKPFNYSAINNYGVTQAYGDIIGLINNDTEVINPEWLTEMVSHAIRPDIGCVGAKLYYSNDTVQHAGVILGIGGVAGHSHKYFSKDYPGYFTRLHLTQNYSAVTAACLLVRKTLYKQVNGLDEHNLTVAFNDVDFCLKVREAGYRNLFTPWAELYHHESISRGAEDTPQKISRAHQEVSFMKHKWRGKLHHDPAYNRNLTLTFENFSLR